MEVFNSKRWMGLIPAICAASSLLFSACNSEDEQPIGEFQKVNLTKSAGNDYVVHLSNGDTIVLSDTTTYTVDDIPVCNVRKSFMKAPLFEQASKVGSVMRAYGFDSQEPESKWKKYLLKKWEKYGVTPGIYIGRYVKVHKSLSIEKGTDAKPGDYNSDKAPKNAMGWDGETENIGFSTTTKSDYISDGVTKIFIINCDLSGRVYNKNIPANPANFEWAYKIESKEDIWD